MAYLREPCLPLPDSYVPSFSSQGDNLTLPNCEWLRHPWVSSVETDATCKLVSQFSHSVMSNSLWPRGLQHARTPCHHQLPEFTQTHAHRVSDAIQPSHPLSSPSPPAFNLSQHQGLFNESALRIRWPKYWSFSFNISPSNSELISFRMDRLDLLQSKGLSRVFSNTTVQKHQFFYTQLPL